MYVVDTDVISRSSPLSDESGRVSAWLEEHRGRTYLSVATLAELQYGASRLHLRGASRQSTALAAWIATVLSDFGDRVLDIDLAAAQRAGELLARAEKAGVDPGFADACIAASADVRGFAVVTFNTRHFAAFDVPFKSPAASGSRP